MHCPIFIDFSGKRILVVGGGSVGSRRASYMQSAGANVTVISKKFSETLKDFNGKLVEADALKTNLECGKYSLVVAATDDAKLNEQICAKASKARVLSCCASDHTKGDIVFPMTSQVSGHTLAYTTLGENPRLLKKVKKLIEDELESR